MPIIDIKSKNPTNATKLANPYYTGTRTMPTSIAVDREDLIWASIYANREQKRTIHVDRRLAYDIACVDYFFEFSSGNLKINLDLKKLEQTQKATASNRIGFIICNITAKKLFKVKHLHHLQGFSGMNIKPNIPTGARPDLIARTGNDYFVVEAKGTLRTSDAAQINAGVTQLNVINTINTNNPYRFVIQTVIDKNNNVIANVVDPNGNEQNITIEEKEYNNYKQLLSDGKDKYTIFKNNLDKRKEINGYYVNDYFIGLINDNDFFIRNDSNFNELYEDNDYKGKIFDDGTVILKKNSA